MFTSIIVPVDFAHPSDAALHAAVSLARRMHVAVRLVTVASPGLDHSDDEQSQRALADTITGPEVQMAVVESNHVADTLVKEAGSESLICMETHARRGLVAAALGSTAEAVVGGSGQPVLLTGPAAPAALDVERALVCVDGPDSLLPLVEAVAVFGLPVRLISVQEGHGRFGGGDDVVEVLADGVRRLRERHGLDAEYEVLDHGDVAGSIVADAKRHRASLIAVGIRHHLGMRSRILGTVAMTVAHDAPAAVLVVPLPGADG